MWVKISLEDEMINRGFFSATEKMGTAIIVRILRKNLRDF